MLILPEATLDGATQRAQAIAAAVRELKLDHLARPLGTITASFGVALFPDHAAEADELLRAADEALYRAKAAEATEPLDARE